MRLNETQIQTRLSALNDWQLDNTQSHIWRDFKFNNFYQTMEFVNAVAAIAHSEDHHPELEIGYNHCRIKYTSHSINGLSEKDFICAGQINALNLT